MIDVALAQRFMDQVARPLERAVLGVVFHDHDPAEVLVELRRFRNSDGGFGHGLEPDKLAPGSQALDVEVAFERLAAVAHPASDLLNDACDWLASIADDAGAVPILMPDNAEHPRAGHWTETHYAPGLNPTAGIVSHANGLGLEHTWASLATEYCFAEIEGGRVEPEGHSLLGLSKFLETAPDRTRAASGQATVRAALDGAPFFKLHADSDAYGVTPLHFAPTPDVAAHSWFSDEIIDGHLDALERDQQADGGWTIAWNPINDATLAAWRGIHTLNALRTLRAYGRV